MVRGLRRRWNDRPSYRNELEFHPLWQLYVIGGTFGFWIFVGMFG